MRKVETCLFMSKTVMCVVYVYDCLFWECSQYDIDKSTKYFKEDGPSYNWEHSKGESVSEFLGIDIKTLDDGIFHFYQTGSIRKVSEAIWTHYFNELSTPTMFETPLGTDQNSPESKIDWQN